MTEAVPYAASLRRLRIALLLSASLNCVVLTWLLYVVMGERPPTPYCAFKPAVTCYEERDYRPSERCLTLVSELSSLSFHQLLPYLSCAQPIEEGYATRDVALACLVAFHQFDLGRALPHAPMRETEHCFQWKHPNSKTAIMMMLYRRLTTAEANMIVQFAQVERYPFTAERLFMLLQEKQKNRVWDTHLAHSVMRTREFWIIDSLFNRSKHVIPRKELLQLILEGEWASLHTFLKQQETQYDLSDATRRRFLLDYLTTHSSHAALLLLRQEWDYALHQMDDAHVLDVLRYAPSHAVEAKRFATALQTSKRGKEVKQQAGEWLKRYYPSSSVLPLHLNTTVSSSAERLYIVQDRDSLWKIAHRFGVTVDQLKGTNTLQSDRLKPGMTLKIPYSGG